MRELLRMPFIGVSLIWALLTAMLMGLLITIFDTKEERKAYFRIVKEWWTEEVPTMIVEMMEGDRNCLAWLNIEEERE